jgi:hypothetical protein
MLVRWSALEATRDTMDPAPIQELLDGASSRGLPGIRLRLMLGKDSPAWAKALGDGPVPYLETQGGMTGSIPDLWDPVFQEEARELHAWIAAQFDEDPRLLLVFAAGGMTWYAEPLIRGVSSPENRESLVAAGYTIEADKALQQAQLDWMLPFERTPVGLAYNPLSTIRADGTAGSEMEFAGELMDQHIALFGARTVLQNNSIQSSFIASPPPLYELFRARVSEPGSQQFQPAAAVRIGDPQATARWAIDYLSASALELDLGPHSDAQLLGYDAELRAQGA